MACVPKTSILFNMNSKKKLILFIILLTLATSVGINAYYIESQRKLGNQIASTEATLEIQAAIRKEIIDAEKKRIAEKKRRLAEITIKNLIRNTNEERKKLGLTELILNPNLNVSAQEKANDMAARNYWGHNTPEGNPPWGFMSRAGYYYSKAAENLACGYADAQAIVNGWMRSPTHRVNIVDPKFINVGFGIVRANNYECSDYSASTQTIVVQHFGTPGN